jgi:FtsH-binding integral membrane protein
MAWIANERSGVGPSVAAGGRVRPADVVGVFLGRVYRLMALGLAVTGFVALLIASSPGALQFFLGNRGVFFGVIIAQLLLVMALSAMVNRISAGTAAVLFFGYAVLCGITFSSIFLIYTGASIAGTFFVTAGAFAGLSAYGAITKRNLDGLGSFVFMGLIGLVIASVVNIFLASPALYWLTTFVGVIVFAGLTAYDTSKLKALAAQTDLSGTAGSKAALRGALMLYLDFINLFLILLRIFGGRRRD